MGRYRDEVRPLGPSVRASANEAAFEADLVDFVRLHHGRLIRLAGLICRDVGDAEDAVQTALERAWRSRAGLRDAERVSGWLDRIVVREAIRMSRRGSRFRWPWRSDDGERDASDLRTGNRGDAIGTRVTARIALQAALDRLPADQRAVVALHLYQGYTMPETAEIIGVPLETARSRLRLAKSRLRASLEEERT